MQNNNQYWETTEQEIVEDLNNPLFGDRVSESEIFKSQDSPTEGDDDLDDDDLGDDGIDEEDESDTIDVDEDYPGPKETNIGHEEQPGINDQDDDRPGANADESEENNQEDDERRRSVDENGQRINWDNPEVSEADGTEGREVGDHEEGPEQPGNLPDKEEVPDDANIRDLYDTNPNASTIRSSNADRTFGNEKQRENGDQGDPDRMSGENES